MTWGISGPNFLLTLRVRPGRRDRCGASVAPGAAGRRAIAAPWWRPHPLSVDELAYLSGGASGLGASALVALREHGEATLLGPRQLVAVGTVTRAGRQPGPA